MKVTWANFKAFVTDHGSVINEAPEGLDGANLVLEAFDDKLYRICILKPDTADYTDYIDNYQTSSGNKVLQTGADGRATIHQTSRTPGFTTYFTSSDDDSTDLNAVGGDSNINDLVWHHEVGDDATENYYLDLNTIHNATHLHSGYLQWKGALNDRVAMQVVPKVTTTSAGSNTNYNLFGGYLVVPAAGDGTLVVQDADRVLVQVPTNLDNGEPMSSGYFDADYNSSTGLFENIAANYAGTGSFNMFSTEILLANFVNRQPVLGSGFLYIRTSDKSDLGHGARIKVITTTLGADHEWYGNISLILHRKRTT